MRGCQTNKDWVKENPTPDDPAIELVERKILVGEDLSQGDRRAVMMILKKFKRLSRVVRALSTSSSMDGQIATLELLQQVSEGIGQLQKIDVDRMRAIACARKSFPVMAAPGPGSTNRINDLLNKLKVGSAYQPGCYTTSKSKQDEFAKIADRIFEMLIVEDHSYKNVKSEERLDLERHVRKYYLPKILETPLKDDQKSTDPAIHCLYDELAKLIKAPGDRETPGRIRNRIRERIFARLWAKLGSGNGLPDLPE